MKLTVKELKKLIQEAVLLEKSIFEKEELIKEINKKFKEISEDKTKSEEERTKKTNQLIQSLSLTLSEFEEK